MWHETAVDRGKMKAMTKSLYKTMVESEYELSTDGTDDESSDDSLLPSEFEGFSDRHTR